VYVWETARVIGILAPMEQELDAVLRDFDSEQAELLAGRTFHRGGVGTREVVAVISGIGKTAVAATTSILIHHYRVRAIVLIGVAGRVSPQLAIGDVVVATHALHHDLDASPIFPRYQVPALGLERLPTDETLSQVAYDAVADFLGGEKRVVRGLVLSGDQFLGERALGELRERFPDGLAVEMEGAAVAQVCIEAGVPCAIVRSISDDGDAGAFERFLERESGRYAEGIIARLLALSP
jgi:adenosylhomocysteine nucleosidase